MQENRAAKSALAGFTAGAVSTLSLHPLDLIKVQLQVDSQRKQVVGGTLNTAQRIVAQNGWFGLYQGLTPNLIGSCASWGIYFWWYELIKAQLRKQEPVDRLSPKQHLMGSALAGALTQLVVNPIWVIKTRMCTQNPLDGDAYTSVFDAVRRMARQEGLSSFYRGMIPAMLGVTHGAIQFMIYEELKIRMNRSNVCIFLMVLILQESY
jgi:solute carrier family 25 folate transporter 32